MPRTPVEPQARFTCPVFSHSPKPAPAGPWATPCVTSAAPLGPGLVLGCMSAGSSERMAQGTQGLEAPGVAERGSPTGFAPGPARKVEGQQGGVGCRVGPDWSRGRFVTYYGYFAG